MQLNFFVSNRITFVECVSARSFVQDDVLRRCLKWQSIRSRWALQGDSPRSQSNSSETKISPRLLAPCHPVCNMGTGSSKFDDKDDSEFLSLDGLSLYNDDYVCALEDKISGGETLPSFEELNQQAKNSESDDAKEPFDSYKGSLESLATVFSSKFDRLLKVEDFAIFSPSEGKKTAFDFMRGRRYLLLDRIFQVRWWGSRWYHVCS